METSAPSGSVPGGRARPVSAPGGSPSVLTPHHVPVALSPRPSRGTVDRRALAGAYALPAQAACLRPARLGRARGVLLPDFHSHVGPSSFRIPFCGGRARFVRYQVPPLLVPGCPVGAAENTGREPGGRPGPARERSAVRRPGVFRPPPARRAVENRSLIVTGMPYAAFSAASTHRSRCEGGNAALPFVSARWEPGFLCGGTSLCADAARRSRRHSRSSSVPRP